MRRVRAGTFTQDDEAKAFVIDPAGDLDAVRNRGRGVPDGALRADERRDVSSHAARRQERDHHRRRLRCRAGVGAALRRGGRPGRRAPISTWSARRRPCDRSRPRAAPRSPPSATCPQDEEVAATVAAAVEQLRAPRHHVQQRRHPDAAPRHDLRGPHGRGLRPAHRGEPRAACSSAASTPSSGSSSRATAA